jgi:primary-amine oxidase
MASERLEQTCSHLTGHLAQSHPLDPLTREEIVKAVAIVQATHSSLAFNAITLWEPRKIEMMRWLEGDGNDPPRPRRIADVVMIGRGSKVYDGLVDLEEEGKILSWALTEGVQPLITMEDLQIVESVVRKDPAVIKQCGILGIGPDEMYKVYVTSSRLC